MRASHTNALRCVIIDNNKKLKAVLLCDTERQTQSQMQEPDHDLSTVPASHEAQPVNRDLAEQHVEPPFE